MNARFLNCHPASPAERDQAFGNVFDVWPHADTLEEHVKRRQSSRQHRQANWFVGCIDDRVAVSMGAYPMPFRLQGETVQGIAIGAVHTLGEYRGRGYAVQLLNYVERIHAEAGGAISLLFSDIRPDYYARLGYVLCPSHEIHIPVEEIPDSEPARLRLREWDPSNEAPALMPCYETHHRAIPFSIARTPGYWDYLLKKEPHAESYWLIEADGQTIGYVTLLVEDSRCRILDFALPRNRLPDLIGAVAVEARRRNANSLAGWLPQLPEYAAFLHPRTKEITMFKPLNDRITIDDETIAAADWLHEIDHV